MVFPPSARLGGAPARTLPGGRITPTRASVQSSLNRGSRDVSCASCARAIDGIRPKTTQVKYAQRRDGVAEAERGVWDLVNRVCTLGAASRCEEEGIVLDPSAPAAGATLPLHAALLHHAAAHSIRRLLVGQEPLHLGAMRVREHVPLDLLVGE